MNIDEITNNFNKILYVCDINYKKLLEENEPKSVIIQVNDCAILNDICTLAEKLGYFMISIKVTFENPDLESRLKAICPNLIKRIEYWLPVDANFASPINQVAYIYENNLYSYKDDKFLKLENTVKKLFENPGYTVGVTLWDNCNQGCIFCGGSGENVICSFNGKREQLKRLKAILININYPVQLHLYGGELFDDENLCQDWTNLANFFADLIEIGRLTRIQVVSNILMKNLACLFGMIEALKKRGYQNRLSIMCSFDIEGRYKSNAEKFRFGRNFIKLWKTNTKCFVNSVLTHMMCKWIVANPDKYFHYAKKVHLQASPFGVERAARRKDIPSLRVKGCPTKDEVTEVLRIWKRYDIDYLKSYNRAKTDYKKILIDCETEECSHPTQTYCDDVQACFFCLLEKICNE